MTQIWKRFAAIVALSVLTVIGLAACQGATSTSAPASIRTPAATPLSEDTQRPGPGRPYAAPDLARIGANGEVQFLNSFATW